MPPKATKVIAAKTLVSPKSAAARPAVSKSAASPKAAAAGAVKGKNVAKPVAAAGVKQAAAPAAASKNMADAKKDISAEAAVSGPVRIRYNHYNQEFIMKEGRLSSAVIDDEYALLYAFPKAHLHLREDGVPSTQPFVKEVEIINPKVGDDESKTITEYHGLELGKTYWVLVEENKEEELKSQEKQKAYELRMAEEKKMDEQEKLKGPKEESCSCIEGNPCAVQYNCKDWKNRHEVAKKHGWKGFS